jgi:hypothetical protein
MREAFLWGQVAGPILGGCLVWGRSGPSMVFSRAVLSACLASLLVPAAWRGPSHVALRLFQGLCTVSRQLTIPRKDPSERGNIVAIFFFSGRDYARCSHARDDLVQEQSQELVLQLLRR